MRLFDTHVHIGINPISTTEITAQMAQAGIELTILLSQEPDRGQLGKAARKSFNQERLVELLEMTSQSPRLLPVHYINVIEEDALNQVDEAVAAGVVGFKVICSNHYPGDERALATYHRIAQAQKPILFHSGILWDFGANADYNRPGNFEALLHVPKLRFALAHIGWPWCDEMIAVFGKFQHMQGLAEFTGQEMYIDMTPGTPPVYRHEVVQKLLTTGYAGMQERLLYGSDNFTDSYSHEYAHQWARTDQKLFSEFGLNKDSQDKIFFSNACNFWNIDPGLLKRLGLT